MRRSILKKHRQRYKRTAFDEAYVGPKYVRAKRKSFAEQFAFACEQSGRSPWAIMREAVWLMYSAHKISWHSYFHFGLYRAEMSFEQKTEFVDFQRSYAISKQVHRKHPGGLERLVDDKYLLKAVLTAHEIATPNLQAIISHGVETPHRPRINTPNDLAEFFLHQAAYPVFCKPVYGTLGRGGVAIAGVDAPTRQLSLTTGKVIPLDAFCSDIFTQFASGYMIEDMVAQHPDLSEMFGETPCVLRLITAKPKDNAPKLLFGFVRFTPDAAMGTQYDTTRIFQIGVDVTSGKFTDGAFETSPFTGETALTIGKDGKNFGGRQFPFFQEALDLASKAHMLFPDRGWIGFDLIVSQNGPVILEGNANPHIFHPQIIQDAGIMSGRTGALLQRVIMSNSAND